MTPLQQHSFVLTSVFFVVKVDSFIDVELSELREALWCLTRGIDTDNQR
jgi:hypothetical protein